MTRPPRFDVAPYLGQDEGQHFDRKSLLEGEPGKKKARDRRTVRDEVLKYVSAFANAEGGVLILGIEDDRTLTGHALPADALQALLDTPSKRLRPAQPPGFVIEHDGVALVVFDVPASDVPVQIEGDGFWLRMGDETVAATEKQIEALKFHGLAESWESKPSPCKLADLDADLLAEARRGAGLAALTDEEYLLKRKLADRRGASLVLRRAAELLFAKHGPEHPNAGIRLFRVVGTERRLGAAHNVEERPRIEGNLPDVLRQVFAAIESIVRRPSRLVGTRFRAVPEYPEFSWKEAILNAIAHRDYAAAGRTTEVWFYDDRLEVLSPGGLPPDVELDALLSLRRVHASRNPRLVRALVDLGFMRDQGEGIPRMFAEMEGLFLPAPGIEASDRHVQITLRNTPTLTAEDHAFVAGLGDLEVSDLEFRALLEAHRHGRIDNARMRTISGLDTLGASQVLRRLRDRGALDLHAAGAASFYTLGPGVSVPPGPGPSERRQLGGRGADVDHQLAPSIGLDGGQLPADGGDLATDRGELAADRGELATDGGELPDGGEPDEDQVPPDVRALLASLGPRPRQPTIRHALLRLLEVRARGAAELARLLGLSNVSKLVERHLGPMVADGTLERTHPDNPTHPEQAYRARQRALADVTAAAPRKEGG